MPAGLLGFLHVIWLPSALVIGFLIAKKHPAKSGKFVGLGCLWSFLLYLGGFIGLIVLGLATCKMDFR